MTTSESIPCKERYEEEMTFLVAHPTLIAFHALRGLFAMAFLGFAVVVASLLPIPVNALLSLGSYPAFWFGLHSDGVVILGGVSPSVLLLLALFFGYFTGYDVGTSTEAFSRLRKRLTEIAKSHQGYNLKSILGRGTPMGFLSRLFDRIPEENTSKPFFKNNNAEERREWFAHTRPWHKVRRPVIDAIIARLDHEPVLFELFVQTSMKGGLVERYAALDPSAESDIASIVVAGMLTKAGMPMFQRHEQGIERVRRGERSEALTQEIIETGSFATDCFEVAVALGPFAPASWGLAILLSEIRKYDEALKYARQGLATVQSMQKSDYSQSRHAIVRQAPADLAQMETTLSDLIEAIEREASEPRK
jgi:hypothetical protein